MPQASETQASGPIFGELEAAFGSRKPPRPIYRDEAIRNLERELTSDVNTARGGLNDVLANYRKNIARNNPLLRNAALESNTALSGALNRSSPLQDVFSLGDYLTGTYKNAVAPYIDPIARNIYNRNTVENMARGLGGNPVATSYGDILRGRVLGGTAANYAQNILGLIPSLYPSLQNANQARFNELLNIFPARRSAFESLESRALNPYQAQLAGLRDLQGLAMGQNQINLSNLQGYQPVENWANRLGAVGRAATTNVNQILDWANQAAGIVGSLYGGGGMGSLGGLFGGGGGGGGMSGSYNDYGGNARAAQAAGMLGGYRPYGDIPTGFQPYA